MSKDFPREAIERAARIYNSNKDAALALGINPSSFGKAVQALPYPHAAAAPPCAA